ncbi:MAG: hypothetical protein AB7G93_23295 [Bdellovibrionales bacterium]
MSIWNAALILFAGLILSLTGLTHADPVPWSTELCNDKREMEGADFNPISEAGKTAAASTAGVTAGNTLSKLAGSLPSVILIREAGVIAGRMLVWFFEASNPAIAALGFILEPSASAKCDVLYSSDPDCLNQNPCIQPISALNGAVQPNQTQSE